MGKGAKGQQQRIKGSRASQFRPNREHHRGERTCPAAKRVAAAAQGGELGALEPPQAAPVWDLHTGRGRAKRRWATASVQPLAQQEIARDSEGEGAA